MNKTHWYFNNIIFVSRNDKDRINMKNEANNSERTIEKVIKEYDELVQKSKGIDPSWKDEEVNALMDRISELEKEYDQTVISFEMEIFQGYTCMGCAVVNDLEVEEEFSLKELSKIHYLVSQLDEELYSEGIMPVLLDGSPELYERMLSAVRDAIFDFFVEDGISQGFIEFDEDELRQNFEKDLENGDFILIPCQHFSFDEHPTEEEMDEKMYEVWYEEEMDRINYMGLSWIRSRYSIDDNVSMEELPDYTVDIPVAFLK